MEEKKVPANVMFRAAATNGGIIGVVSILFIVITYLTGDIYSGKSWLNWVSLAASVGLLVYFGLKYRQTACEGYISYGDSFLIMWITYIFAGLVSLAFMVVLQTVIEPEFMDKALEAQRQIMIEKGMSDSQVDAVLQAGAKFRTPLMIFVFGLVGNALIGLVISLITAIFVHKKRPVFEQ
jgi:hypothetical protein